MSERKRSQTAETPQETKEAAKKDSAVAEIAQDTKPAPTTAAGSSKKAAGPLMYVGPTITGFAIQNRVYTSIPAEAEERFEVEPSLRNLFIPVWEYPKANRMIREGTGYIYSAYLTALTLRR